MKIVRVSLLIFMLLFFSINSVSGGVSQLTITPENPVVGDEITMSGKAGINEVLTPSISFKVTEKTVKGKGTYKYIVNNIEVPILNSIFEVRAEKVKNLNVEVGKWGLSWTLRKNATNGIASISQGKVPSWTYNIKIYGTAVDGESSVQLNIKESSKITADNKGNFKVKYSTSKIPAGVYTLAIDGKTVTINLLEKNEKISSVAAASIDPINTQVSSNADADIENKKTEEETETPAITETPSVTHKNDALAPAPTVTPTKPETFLNRLLSKLKFWK